MQFVVSFLLLLLQHFLLGTTRVFYATPRNAQREFFMIQRVDFLDFFVRKDYEGKLHKVTYSELTALPDCKWRLWWESASGGCGASGRETVQCKLSVERVRERS